MEGEENAESGEEEDIAGEEVEESDSETEEEDDSEDEEEEAGEIMATAEMALPAVLTLDYWHVTCAHHTRGK